jgi:predicted HTH domain antitoxin
MEMIAKAIEATGIITQHQLLLDEPLPVAESNHVRVIVLVTEETNNNQSIQVSDKSSESLTSNRRLTTAIDKYLEGEISEEKAAELAQLNRRDFLSALARDKRDVFQVDFNDLTEELARG